MKKQHVKLASDFYDEIIDLHHEEFNYGKIHYKDWLKLLTSKLNKKDIILDLGCGNGRAIKYFVDREFRGIGIDVSEEMLKLARKHVPKGDFYKKEFTNIRFKPESINAVISFFALNHIPKTEFEKVLKICKKCLIKDGFLLLGMVKGKSEEGIWEGFYGKKLKLYGKGYTKKELIETLKLHGYKIVKTEIRHFKGKHFEEDNIYVLAKNTASKVKH